MYCSKCGALLPEEARFCNKCGTKIELKTVENSIPKSTQNVAEVTRTAKSQKSRKPLLIAFGLLFLIIASIGIIHSLRKNSVETIVYVDEIFTVTTNHNDNKRIASADVYSGDGELYERLSFEYDVEGKLVKERVVTEGDPDYYLEHRFEYNGNGQLEREYAIDSDGDDDWYEKKYGYDSKGNLIQYEYSTIWGDRLAVKYDNNGNIIEASDGWDTFQYEYDGNGRLTEISEVEDVNPMLIKLEYADKSGRLTKISGLSGKYDEITAQYREKDSYEGIDFMIEDETCLSVLYTRDQFAKIKEVTAFDMTGDPICSGRYDSRKSEEYNVLMLIFYKQIFDAENTDLYLQCEYDADKNVIKQVFYRLENFRNLMNYILYKNAIYQSSYDLSESTTAYIDYVYEDTRQIIKNAKENISTDVIDEASVNNDDMFDGTTEYTSTLNSISIEETSNTKWSDAYYDLIFSGEYKTYSEYYTSDLTPITFALHDMNGDGVPELVTTNGSDGLATATAPAFTYANNDVKYLGYFGSRVTETSFWYSPNNKNYPGLFQFDGNMGVYEGWYYTLGINKDKVDPIHVLHEEDGEVTIMTSDAKLYSAYSDGNRKSLQMYSIDDIQNMGWDTFVAKYV